MSHTPLIVIEVFLAFGLAVGWGVWQLLELRRERRRDELARRAESDGRHSGHGDQR